PRIVRADPDRPDLSLLVEAAQLMRSGGLVAFPTETVYGLGANALDVDAVARLFAAKGRPADNPLIIHIADRAQLADLTLRVSPLARSLAERFWPGPLTIVLDAAEALPRLTIGGHSTVAVRIPDHPIAIALLSAAAVPIAAPSANRSGRPSPTTAEHVVADLDGHIDLIIDGGPCPVGLESTVVDARGASPVILRPGAVTAELLGVAGPPPAADASRSASPGTRYRHYAPRCQVAIVAPGTGPARADLEAAAGRSVGLVATAPATDPRVRMLAVFTDAASLASDLYEALRAGETAGVDVVVVEAVPEAGIGRAVMDRLRRAAEGE
ncbi:MAG TPA: L-threonylcarbamoyladenylate synthase, partial [Egibacteraceae bacterium]|nr:L-threonylcarbamoyladenylate synthase [Egibacteraceae bacterium]